MVKTQWDRAMEWIAESDYIARVALAWPGKEASKFNGDRECFARYVRMQQDSALKQGFTRIARELNDLLSGFVAS
jgi:hypothetical protein